MSEQENNVELVKKGYDADVFTLRDGKTIRVQVHTDTAVMERVYGKKQVAAG